jgi:hypothetical protein
VAISWTQIVESLMGGPRVELAANDEVVGAGPAWSSPPMGKTIVANTNL